MTNLSAPAFFRHFSTSVLVREGKLSSQQLVANGPTKRAQRAGASSRDAFFSKCSDRGRPLTTFNGASDEDDTESFPGQLAVWTPHQDGVDDHDVDDLRGCARSSPPLTAPWPRTAAGSSDERFQSDSFSLIDSLGRIGQFMSRFEKNRFTKRIYSAWFRF